MINISILITYFNERELLTSCLESLLAQTVKPDEILIYDDASDHPPETFLPEGLIARVIRGERNVGPGAGRNILLKEATGDYIHFHDSDDWFHPNWCEAVCSQLMQTPVDVLFTEVTSSSSGLPDFNYPFMGFARFDDSTDLTSVAIRGALLIPSGTIRREKALHIGGFRTGLWQSEDKDFYIRLAASGVSWAVDVHPLICIRNRPDSRSKDKAKVWQDGLKCLEFASKELPKRYHQDIANAAAQCATQLLQIDQKESARRALTLVQELGGADYSWRNPGFRWFVRLLGAERAEHASSQWQWVKGCSVKWKHVKSCSEQ